MGGPAALTVNGHRRTRRMGSGMSVDREDIAAAIAAADIGGWGSTLDLDAAVDNVMDLLAASCPDEVASDD